METPITHCSADLFKKIHDFYQEKGKIRELVSAQNEYGKTALMSTITDIISLNAKKSPADTNINQMIQLKMIDWYTETRAVMNQVLRKY